MKELKDNSKLYKIYPSITQIRKEYEDNGLEHFILNTLIIVMIG